MDYISDFFVVANNVATKLYFLNYILISYKKLIVYKVYYIKY